MPAPTFLSVEQWKAQIEQGETPDEVFLRKGYVAEEIKIIESERQVRFIISTEDVDRDRDTIAIDGWDLTEYRKSPVVLWSHMYGQPPIAKSVEITIGENKLKSLAQFPTREIYPFADTLYRLVKGGYLSAASVGFRPLEWTINEERRGVDFKRQALTEWSLCCIGSNPMALVDAKSQGVIDAEDGKLLLDWAEQILDEWHGEKGLWLPKSKVEAVFTALNTTTHVDLDPHQTPEPPAETAAPVKQAGASAPPASEEAPTAPPVMDAVVSSPAASGLLASLLKTLKTASDSDLADLLEICELLLARRHPEELTGEVVSLDTFLASAVPEDYHHTPVDDLAHIDPDELRGLLAPVLGELVTAAMGKQITALTGRLVD